MYRRNTSLLLLTTACLIGAVYSMNLIEQQQIELQRQRQQSEQSRNSAEQQSQTVQRQAEQAQREQVQQQQQEIIQQQQALLQQQLDESNAKNPEPDMFREHLIPNSNDSIEEVQVGRALLSSKKNSKAKGKWFSIQRDEYDNAVESQRTRSTKKMGRGPSSYSCCRRETGLQIKEMRAAGYIEFTYRSCSWNYCTTCKNDMASCSGLRRIGCNPASRFYSFMSAHCPETCGWCNTTPNKIPKAPSTAPKRPVTTRRPITTRKTTVTRRPTPPVTRATQAPTTRTMRTTTQGPTTAPMKRVQVFFNSQTNPYRYMFTTSSRQPGYPWRKASESGSRGEVGSFFMYESPTSSFNTPIYFCKATSKRDQKWMVSRSACRRGWRLDFRLYASRRAVPSSEYLFVSNRGQTPWTSRISKSNVCCGYMKALWTVFVPTYRHLETTKRPIVTPRTTTRAPKTVPKRPTTPYVAPTTPSRKPAAQPKSTFERDCLHYHNFYRSLHNSPPLKWDPELVDTSQRWSDFLLDAAPQHPFNVKQGVKKTRNWPHSEKPSSYRKRGVGENIAWDFSIDGSPAQESVLRWYAEIFYFEKNNPTHSHTNKPVGHYTQLLWKETTHIGCAVAIKEMKRGRRTYKSTYTVAHYAPGGNVVYRRKSDTLANYAKNVPDPKRDTCRTARSCSGDGGCMGFTKNFRCSCPQENTSGLRGRPSCSGRGGCIVACERPKNAIKGYYQWSSECHGETSCECVYKVTDYKAGAICK